jgi:hypothetical protein
MAVKIVGTFVVPSEKVADQFFNALEDLCMEWDVWFDLSDQEPAE